MKGDFIRLNNETMFDIIILLKIKEKRKRLTLWVNPNVMSKS